MSYAISNLIGNKRKQPETIVDSSVALALSSQEPSNRGNTVRKKYRVREMAATTTTTTSAAVATATFAVDEEKNTNEKNAKCISQILEELPTSKDADGVVYCLNELANLMHPDNTITEDMAEANAKHLHDFGGHGLILHCLRALANDYRVQVAGIVALQNLTGSLFEDTVYDSLAKAGVVKVIINAMIQFPDYQTQKAGCGVLLNLSGGSVAVKQTILREGGVACICSAMRKHSNCPKIQMRGCKVLRALKVDLPDDTIYAIWKAKGVSLMVAAIENHPSDAALRTAAYLALEGLFG